VRAHKFLHIPLQEHSEGNVALTPLTLATDFGVAILR
jgi:hypothetical protein